jgi:hypothetical protein
LELASKLNWIKSNKIKVIVTPIFITNAIRCSGGRFGLAMKKTMLMSIINGIKDANLGAISKNKISEFIYSCFFKFRW